jgi:hypothetical protein
MTDVTTLWRPTGEHDLALVADSGWSAWPPRLPDQPIFYPVLNQWYATKIAREWNVPAGGVGYVSRFDVSTEYLSRHQVRQAGGRDVLEYWIPAEQLDEFNENIVGHIVMAAEYRAPLDDASLTAQLPDPLPAAWRAYLQGESWFCRGWVSDNTYVHLYQPTETAGESVEWADTHRGIAILGDDGGRERLAVDLRLDDPPVVTVDVTNAGWADAIEQAESVTAFVGAIEGGSFTFRR